MKIIINNQENTQIINKSKFIGIVMRVDTKEEIDNVLLHLKGKYKDATHICYAYILPDSKKYFDDNEPSGTAGKPILNILEKNDLNYVLAVVIRYFGGIKLGSNGLIHAYSSSINNLIINNIKEGENGYLIKITEDYNKSLQIDYLLKNSKIIKKEFQDKLFIEVLIKEEVLPSLNDINFTIIRKEIV